ncbi:MAG: alpha/beta hydrolase [Novosphingobium sp.]
MILRFMHGWGFDAGFWTKLIAELPEWSVRCDDRGYFGAPDIPEPDRPCIIVAHSFGAMRALSASPGQCRGLVAINGFDRFTPGVSPRIVDRTIARFDSDATTVLADFRRGCGDDSPVGPVNPARLRQDLLALRDMDCTTHSAAWRTPILSLQGGSDPLLPTAMREEVFAAARLLERMTHPEGGHLLAVSDAPYCACAIRAFARHVE